MIEEQSPADADAALKSVEEAREADFYREEDEMPLDEEGEDDN